MFKARLVPSVFFRLATNIACFAAIAYNTKPLTAPVIPTFFLVDIKDIEACNIPLNRIPLYTPLC